MNRAGAARHPYPIVRMTPQRRAIAEAVESMPGAFTAEELLVRLRTSDSACDVGRGRMTPAPGSSATVYRALAAMEAAGHVERVGERDGRALFARCGSTRHHHHIVCDGCGRVAHAECPIAPPAATARTDGFIVTRHEVTLYGLCPECQRLADGK